MNKIEIQNYLENVTEVKKKVRKCLEETKEEVKIKQQIRTNLSNVLINEGNENTLKEINWKTINKFINEYLEKDAQRKKKQINRRIHLMHTLNLLTKK